jgi:hypothetical protein
LKFTILTPYRLMCSVDLGSALTSLPDNLNDRGATPRGSATRRVRAAAQKAAGFFDK